MRILIVDDDWNLVDTIKREIDWSYLQIKEVYTAYNMAAAMELIERQQPEIVLCDIEMPLGSGIDLLKWIRKKQLPLEFIFLTCHDNFDFASEAIEYGVSGYVVKPFNIEKTVSAIAKAQRKVLHKNHLEEYSRYGEYWLAYQRKLTQDFWEDVTGGRYAEEKEIFAEAKKRKIELQPDGRYRLVLISASKSQSESDFYEYFHFIAGNMAAEILQENPEDNNQFVCDTDHHYCILQLVTGGISGNEVKKRCEDIVFYAGKYLKTVVNCFVSRNRAVTDLKGERDALEEMNRQILITNGQVLFSCQKQAEKELQLFRFPKKKYEELLESGRQLTIVNSIKSDIESLIKAGRIEKVQFDAIRHNFLQAAITVLERQEVDIQLLLQDEIMREPSQNAIISAFDLIRWTDYVSGRTIQLLKENKKTGNAIKLAKQFIKEHYMEDISRNSVADSVYLSHDYFAKLFHAETGELFNDYLNRYRIEKAKELLRRKDMEVGTIAFQVGYSSVSYFSTVFKKYEGMTPGDFRKKLI